MHHTTLLGWFRASAASRDIAASDWTSSRSLMLFRYLALHRSKGFISKYVLVEMLRPDQDPHRTGRRFNTAILAPRFLSSAFASGLALLILMCLVIRRLTDFDPGKQAVQSLAVIAAYALVANLFFMALRKNHITLAAPGFFYADRHHCHLKKGQPAYVAVWQVADKEIRIM